ncbi:hypothetical protein CCR75_006897 [Bremia lactucae]|uniref:Calmodulin n=1 Tax=Bremia lactucae TaxID=4779 RepID=A0A976FG08_BRELC|nr:hypothetical protein CCR75_006897 [Bremia lactucae]
MTVPAEEYSSQEFMEKELSSGSTLHRESEKSALRRWWQCNHNRSSENGSRLAAGHEAFSSTTSESDHRSRQLSIPHTVTEKNGGQELWVKAPVVSGSLEKRGFRWRKKWKVRFVELNGRQLAYYEDSSKIHRPTTATANRSKKNRTLKMNVEITADAVLTDVDALTLSITPAQKAMPWVLRAKDAATKRRWLVALSDCIDILVWLRHYQVGAVVGVGGNGVVQELEDKRDGTVFAVKVLDVAKFRHREQAVAEIEIMRSITNNITHPNLVKIHKVYEELQKVYIVQEMCTGGELYDRIVQRGKLSEQDAANILQQLMSALEALHQHNILHLDIKPENILFSSKEPDSKIILTDFGLARIINGKQHPLGQDRPMAGTVGYIAPEVISSHVYSEAADVFGAGVILYILLVGRPPFYGDSEVEVLSKTARGDYSFDPKVWKHVSESAKQLVARMLEMHAQERITVKEVLAHPWITRQGSTSSSESDEERGLTTSMITRLQQFSLDRKSQNMGSFMASMLLDDNEADFQTLVDEKTIELVIRQLSVDGNNRLPLDGAHVILKGIGLSPYMDEKAFVQFLDQNHDGFIDASDFCASVRAVRNHHESFAKIVFSAIQLINFDDKSDLNVEDIKAPALTRQHFAKAFDKLECPKSLAEVFYKCMDENLDAKSLDNSSMPKVSSWSVTEDEFATLLTQFSFLGMLFMQTAKANVISIVKTHSGNDMPRISEDMSSSRSKK